MLHTQHFIHHQTAVQLTALQRQFNSKLARFLDQTTPPLGYLSPNVDFEVLIDRLVAQRADPLYGFVRLIRQHASWVGRKIGL